MLQEILIDIERYLSAVYLGIPLTDDIRKEITERIVDLLPQNATLFLHEISIIPQYNMDENSCIKSVTLRPHLNSIVEIEEVGRCR